MRPARPTTPSTPPIFSGFCCFHCGSGARARRRGRGGFEKATRGQHACSDQGWLSPATAPVGAVDAATALNNTKNAIIQLSSDRSVVGANVSVLSSYSEQLGVLKDNLSAANSRIKDVDVAEESTKFARYNILVQAGTAMLAQANTGPQSALRLLQ